MKPTFRKVYGPTDPSKHRFEIFQANFPETSFKRFYRYLLAHSVRGCGLGGEARLALEDAVALHNLECASYRGFENSAPIASAINESLEVQSFKVVKRKKVKKCASKPTTS